MEKPSTISIIVAMVFAAFVSGCATSAKENFDKLQVGMHKDAVLDTVGSPNSSVFKKGEYVWTYRIYEGDAKVLKEVRMKNDIVTYVGDLKTPANPFDHIKVGMDKADVLDLLGFPKRVEKKGSSEVWTYYDGKTPMSFVITAGKVSSLAPPTNESVKSDGFVPVEN